MKAHVQYVRKQRTSYPPRRVKDVFAVENKPAIRRNSAIKLQAQVYVIYTSLVR